MAVVAMAGPATNLALGVIALQLGPFVDVYANPLTNAPYWYPSLGIGLTAIGIWVKVLLGFALVNFALAIFNMLPIPPLDGSKLVPLALTEKGRQVFHQVSQYGFLILFLLIFIVLRGELGFMADAIGWLMRVFV
jgi:Zn-dependent protease